jgi:hypothetical protein
MLDEASVQCLLVRKVPEQGPGRDSGPVGNLAGSGIANPIENQLTDHAQDLLPGRRRAPDPSVDPATILGGSRLPGYSCLTHEVSADF